MPLRSAALCWLLCLATSLSAQIPDYYADVDLRLTGPALFEELSAKVTYTETGIPRYTPGVWDALKLTDLAEGSTDRIVLIYGYDDTDDDLTNDRTRAVDANGGGTTDWNREHVYPKSLGTPNLGTSGPGADVHHLRPSDVRRNSRRSNRKFADGAGNSDVTPQGHWYPGDEFKGDVARIILYLYLRYGDRCLPRNVGVGTPAPTDPNMLNLFLEWNAEDPVSFLERQRNLIVETIQGNRNPFIDNPAFATSIWGGPQAEVLIDPPAPEDKASEVFLRIDFDDYPGETSWEITDGQQRIRYAGDDYNLPTDGARLVIPVPLPAGCYTLTFYDSYGDGLCCGYGQGGFSLDVNGEQVAAGARFNRSLSRVFCVEGD